MAWTFYINDIEVAEPIGWDSIEFTSKRMEWHGVDQPFSTELTFIGESAKMLKAIYDVNFINSNTKFKIKSDIKVESGHYDFDGFIDYSAYSEIKTCDQTGWSVIVGIIESSFKDEFLSRQDVEVNLYTTKDLNQNDIDPLTIDQVRLHSQDLYLVANARNLAEGTGDIYPVDALGAFVSAPYQMPFYFKNTDFKGQFGNSFDPTGVVGSESNVLLVNNGTVNREFRWVGNIDMSGFYIFAAPTSLVATFRVVLVIYDTSIPAPYEFSITTLAFSPPIAYNTTEPLVFSFDETIVLEPNQRATIQARWFLPSPIIDAALNRIRLTVNDCCLNITENNRSEFGSLCNGLYIFNYLKRLIYIITGNDDGLISDFFELGSGCEWNYLLTNGLNIRNAQTIQETLFGCGTTETETELDVYQIKTTWKKATEGLNAIFCIGWQFEYIGTEWKIRVEDIGYFYNSTKLIGRFVDVSDFKQYALVDDLTNNFTIGYKDKWKNTSLSGNFEIHTDREYFVPNKARKDNSTVRLDLRSDIIASGRAIEFSRRLQTFWDDSGSSDRPNDYETFIIWLNRDELSISDIEDSGYGLPNETGTIIFAQGKVSYGSNFIEESNAPIDRLYNINITPARVAARWWKWVGMNTYGLPENKAKLFFQVGQYFTDYSSRIGADSLGGGCEILNEDSSTVLYENADIEGALLIDPRYLLRPIGIELTVPQSLCSFISMGNPGNGFVFVRSGKSKFVGYIKSATNQPENPQSGITTLTLLSANIEASETIDYSDTDYSEEDYG